ncbi:phosphatidylinositol mannoside acyltransferase [Pseudonocardia sp. KRD-184]|uniref:Phosphatidylinositol mannoside acyltransferase n=1 Tax=Pseudonocardia oceani TaxID=2792013 RepID=A0ABS6UJB0_9PSEU|nr:phosphatidylinositol mannoside acyltransferase [Pseudonocardia oceani]MBW0092807.1 phosphatidylinositol mannoside acyltransferase [Pseudonocardia oceani]MBW0099474.1 phosphatidylinositol mannoside acyltransferase [Pseudonocardia oceani]MBW0112344.1 phosphatidylinositol mannoside acyltransferase [Pseudonocardia oceani]MBW0125514.1 phosphatidylinositol mannoside acyltransferase [Pseudonocardia oceani]MBW0132335.1 phosphatidylinositol mannoside acyltransferase [Pseudonocardia oceani]
MSVRPRLVDAGYAAGWAGVRRVPGPLAQWLFRLGADRAVRGDGPGVRQLRANLARLAPGADLDALVRAGMRSYARYWCEVFRLPAMDLADLHRRTDPHVRGAGPFLEAQANGRGVVFALTHSGNWDAAGVWLVETLRALGREPAFTTVAAKLEPESLYRRFVAYRESLGFEVVAAQDGAHAYRALHRRLRGGGVVCLVSDLDMSRSGADVELCGEPARVPAGAARLAAATGALLLPAVPSFTPDGWALDFAAPVPVPDRAAVAKATQGVADALGAMLARVPADWHMLQPIWTADRP